MRISAYLTIFDDWELLGLALASVYDRVEEIVVVDGAYRWMAPMFAAMGRDPSVSCAEVQAALAPFAAKLRILSGLWENEVEKRAAGFAACRERYVLRIDADEVLFFDDAEIEHFAASDKGVAWMRMPIYLAPGLIRARSDREIETQCFLFDRERIEPVEHCAYLWLALSEAERAKLPPKRGPLMIHRPVVAFNAHLTQWRTPRSSVHRARFYVLNYMRTSRDPTGLVPGAIPEGLDDGAWCKALFEQIAPDRFVQLLLGRDLTVGWTALEGFGVMPGPLDAAQERRFVDRFAAQLAALAACNAGLSRKPHLMRTGEERLIDLSSVTARTALGSNREVVLTFSEPVRAIEARRMWQSATAPHSHAEPVSTRIVGKRVSLDLPLDAPEDCYRCLLSLTIWTESGGPFVSLTSNP
jgi:hypothetical protein